jgi:hypothetical protein
MKNKILLLSLVFSMICGSTALALDPMGPPSASLQQGQMNLGFDYSYSDQSLWRTQGYDADFTGMTQKMNKLYARLGYGISNKTEGFIRLGVSDYDYTRDGYYAPWKGDDDGTLAMGAGIKATFFEEENVKWGGIAQVSWAEFDGKRTNSDSSSNYQTGTFETEVVELQLAAGPTIEIGEGVSIYGGPFLHYLDGNHKHKHAGGSRSYDIEERSSLGAYIGSQLDLGESSTFYVEYQCTGDADAVAGGITFVF